MISEITTIAFEMTSFLQYLFYLINDDQYNDLKRMFGWKNVNYILFFITFMVFLLSIGCIFRIVKFCCWITTLLVLCYLMYFMF